MKVNTKFLDLIRQGCIVGVSISPSGTYKIDLNSPTGNIFALNNFINLLYPEVDEKMSKFSSYEEHLKYIEDNYNITFTNLK